MRACGSVAHSEAALTVLEVEAATLRRFWPHTNLHVKDAILRSESNAANVKHNLGRHEEALQSRRAVCAGYRSLHGESHESTISAGNCLTESLISLGLFAEAKKCAREQHAAARSLSEKDQERMMAAIRLGESLIKDPAAAYADATEAVALYEYAAKKSRVFLGPGHPTAAIAARNLAALRDYLAAHGPQSPAWTR